MSLTCEYCQKIFTSASNLAHHKRRTKACIEKQSQLDIEGLERDSFEQKMQSLVDMYETKLQEKDVEILALKEKNEEIVAEMRAQNEFFGYNECMSMQDKQTYKEQCEEDEKELRQDESYGVEAEKGDEIVDLVIELGEYQFGISEVYAQIHELIDKNLENVTGHDLYYKMKKEFIHSFEALKETIQAGDKIEFIDLMKEMIRLEKCIILTDEKIKNYQEDV